MPAGQVTFVITNVDALSVTEVELVSDQRIVGERENLAPGFDSTFSARLDGGTYQVFCPGAATEKQPFTVTGEAAAQSADLTALLNQATVDYATYVDDQITFLLVPVQELATAIKAGDLGRRAGGLHQGPARSTSGSSRSPSRSRTWIRRSTCGSATSRPAPPGPASTRSSRRCSRSRPPRA